MSIIEKFYLAILICISFIYVGTIILYCITDLIDDYEYDDYDED